MAFLDETGLAELWKLIGEASGHYVWAKVKYQTVYKAAETEEKGAYLSYAYRDTGTGTFQYASSITVTESGIALVNPTSLTISASNYSDANSPTLQGKYVKVNNTMTSNVDAFYKMPNAYYSLSGKTPLSSYYWGVHCEQAVRLVHTSELDPVVYGYVNSPNPNAYPVDDEYTYIPLGRLGANMQISVGSYVGTGTYGANNPCSLTFDFAPKMIAFFSADGVCEQIRFNSSSNSDKAAIFTTDTLSTVFSPGGLVCSEYYSYSENTSYYYGYSKKSADGKTLYWYATNLSFQRNISGQVYRYIAIG